MGTVYSIFMSVILRVHHLRYLRYLRIYVFFYPLQAAKAWRPSSSYFITDTEHLRITLSSALRSITWATGDRPILPVYSSVTSATICAIHRHSSDAKNSAQKTRLAYVWIKQCIFFFVYSFVWINWRSNCPQFTSLSSPSPYCWGTILCVTFQFTIYNSSQLLCALRPIYIFEWHLILNVV